MLKKLLTAIMVLSLLVCGFVCVLWLRAPSGHRDEFTIPWLDVKYHFESVAPRSPTDSSRWAVKEIRKIGDGYASRTEYVPFKSVVGCTLIIPAIWLAIVVRRMIPRPTRPPRERLLSRG